MGPWSDGWPVKRLGVADAPKGRGPRPRRRSRPDKAPAPETPVMGSSREGGPDRGPGRATPFREGGTASPRPVASWASVELPLQRAARFGHQSLSLIVVSWPGRLAGP